MAMHTNLRSLSFLVLIGGNQGLAAWDQVAADIELRGERTF